MCNCRELGLLTICSSIIRSFVAMFSILVLSRKVYVMLVYLLEVAGVMLVGYWCSVCSCPCLVMRFLGAPGFDLSPSSLWLRMRLTLRTFSGSIVIGFSGFVFCVASLLIPLHVWSRVLFRRDRGQVWRYWQRPFRGTSRKSVMFGCWC